MENLPAPPVVPKPDTPALNFDILENVFHFLNPGLIGDEARSSRRNLLSAALTCQEFLNPALNALWNSMNSLMPLLRLLPTFEEINGVYALCGPIRDEHWDRLDFYAMRIRQFFFEDDPLIVQSTYVQLATLRYSPLLPALRRLDCERPASLSRAHILVSSALQEVRLKNLVIPEDHIVRPFMSSLSAMSPNLRHIVFHGQISIASSCTVLQFACLNSLELTGEINFQLFQQIGAISSLESLSLDLKEQPFTPHGAIGFKQLKKLHIKGSLSIISPILKYLETRRMASLSILAIITPGRNQLNGYGNKWEKCFSTVTSLWSLSLKSVTIEQNVPMNLVETWPDAFSYLSRLRRLEHLKVQGWFLTSNEVIRQLALACPSIKELQLMSSGPTQPTVAALRTFAELCPNLGFLQVGLDISSDPPILDSDIAILSHTLETIYFCGSPRNVRTPQSLSLVARYIDRLFPSAVSIKVDENAGDWALVKSMIHMYQGVRTDDYIRRRANKNSNVGQRPLSV